MNFKKFVVAVAVSGVTVAPFVSASSAMAAGPSKPEVTKSAISEGQAHFWLATTDQKVRLKLGPKDAHADVIYQDARQLELYPLYPKMKKGGVLRYTFIIESAKTGKRLAPKKTIKWSRWAKYKSSCSRREPVLVVKAKTRPEVGYVRAKKIKGEGPKYIYRTLKVELAEKEGEYMLTRKALPRRYRINGMAVLMTEGPNSFKKLACA